MRLFPISVLFFLLCHSFLSSHLQAIGLLVLKLTFLTFCDLGFSLNFDLWVIVPDPLGEHLGSDVVSHGSLSAAVGRPGAFAHHPSQNKGLALPDDQGSTRVT